MKLEFGIWFPEFVRHMASFLHFKKETMYRKLLLCFYIIILCGLFSSPLRAAPNREVLILRARPDQLHAALREALGSAWQLNREMTKAARDDAELHIKIKPLKPPYQEYVQFIIVRREKIWPAGVWRESFGEKEVEIYRELLRCLGVPKHHRQRVGAGGELPYIKAQRIAFRLKYNVDVVNPVGLVAISVPGRDGLAVGYFDVHICDRIVGLIAASERLGLKMIFNSTFRPAPKQWKLFKNADTNPYPVAFPGQSRHEAGFAFDVQIHQWTQRQYESFKSLASIFGFATIPGDPIHFQADPQDYGYPNVMSAIMKNQLDYYRNHQNVRPKQNRMVATENRSASPIANNRDREEQFSNSLKRKGNQI